MFQQNYELIIASNIFEKKSLINNVYAKYLLRSKKINKFKESALIDTTSAYTAFNKNSSLLQNKKKGFSIKLNALKFVNKLNNNLLFTLPTTTKVVLENKLEKIKKNIFIKKKKYFISYNIKSQKRGVYSIFTYWNNWVSTIQRVY